MRERLRDKGRLEDIVAYSDNVTKLIEGFTPETFEADMRTYFAVMKNIEIVGEAAYMLTKDFKDAHPETVWPVIEGMRHILVHGYASINPNTLYDTAVNGIPELRSQIERYLSETNWKEWSDEENP